MPPCFLSALGKNNTWHSLSPDRNLEREPSKHTHAHTQTRTRTSFTFTLLLCCLIMKNYSVSIVQQSHPVMNTAGFSFVTEQNDIHLVFSLHSDCFHAGSTQAACLESKRSIEDINQLTLNLAPFTFCVTMYQMSSVAR